MLASRQTANQNLIGSSAFGDSVHCAGCIALARFHTTSAFVAIVTLFAIAWSDSWITNARAFYQFSNIFTFAKHARVQTIWSKAFVGAATHNFCPVVFSTASASAGGIYRFWNLYFFKNIYSAADWHSMWGNWLLKWTDNYCNENSNTKSRLRNEEKIIKMSRRWMPFEFAFIYRMKKGFHIFQCSKGQRLYRVCATCCLIIDGSRVGRSSLTRTGCIIRNLCGISVRCSGVLNRCGFGTWCGWPWTIFL